MIRGRVTNEKMPEKIGDKMMGLDQAVQGKAVQFALLLQQNIRSNLADVLGEKARHLDVSINQGGFVTIITVKPKTSVGQFMWSGTRPHRITAQRPMPIGDGRFAYTVNHPGTAGKSREIHSAINKAIMETRTALSGFPRVVP